MKYLANINKLQAFCIGCLAVPILSFALGLLSAAYPFLVFVLSIAGGGILWVMALKVISNGKNLLDSRTITAVASASAGGVYGYLTGLIVGNQGEYPEAMFLVAFAFGLIGAVAYRSYYRDLHKVGASVSDGLASLSDAGEKLMVPVRLKG